MTRGAHHLPPLPVQAQPTLWLGIVGAQICVPVRSIRIAVLQAAHRFARLHLKLEASQLADGAARSLEVFALWRGRGRLNQGGG